MASLNADDKTSTQDNALHKKKIVDQAQDLIKNSNKQDNYDLKYLKQDKQDSDMSERDLRELRNDLEELDRLITSKKIMQDSIFSKKAFILSKILGSNLYCNDKILDKESKKNNKKFVKSEEDLLQCAYFANQGVSTQIVPKFKGNVKSNNRPNRLYVVAINKDRLLEFLKGLSHNNKMDPYIFITNDKIGKQQNQALKCNQLAKKVDKNKRERRLISYEENSNAHNNSKFLQ